MNEYSKITKIDIKDVQKVLLFYKKSKGGGPLFQGGHYCSHQGKVLNKDWKRDHIVRGKDSNRLGL